MQFPTKPTCHEGAHFHTETSGEWKLPDGNRPWRHCGYCGSIHPEDLLTALAGGARLGGSDWKYGWPHKFYIDNIPDPQGSGVRHHGKWYNEHLMDEGYDEEALTALLGKLALYAGVRFELREGKLYYAAPHRGYQR